MLLSSSVDDALDQMKAPEIKGKRMYVDPANLAAYDSPYVIIAIRNKLAELGAVLVEDRYQAELIAELGSGGLASEYRERNFGIPEIPIPGAPTGLPAVTLYQSRNQSGLSKIVIFITEQGRYISSYELYGTARHDESSLVFIRVVWRNDIDERRRRAELRRLSEDKYIRRRAYNPYEY